jgi:hypothetical protein
VIRQKRAKDKKAKVATDVALVSAPAAETPCQASGPAKGLVVRSVSMVAKGLYNSIGGASTTTARDATFVTTDRCDGTITDVGKGKVTVVAKAAKGKKKAKTVTVKAGSSYIVKAKLFAARKGRGPIKG